MIAIPITNVMGAPISSLILDHVHWLGLSPFLPPSLMHQAKKIVYPSGGRSGGSNRLSPGAVRAIVRQTRSRTDGNTWLAEQSLRLGLNPRVGQFNAFFKKNFDPPSDGIDFGI